MASSIIFVGSTDDNLRKWLAGLDSIRKLYFALVRYYHTSNSARWGVANNAIRLMTGITEGVDKMNSTSSANQVCGLAYHVSHDEDSKDNLIEWCLMQMHSEARVKHDFFRTVKLTNIGKKLNDMIDNNAKDTMIKTLADALEPLASAMDDPGAFIRAHGGNMVANLNVHPGDIVRAKLALAGYHVTQKGNELKIAHRLVETMKNGHDYHTTPEEETVLIRALERHIETLS